MQKINFKRIVAKNFMCFGEDGIDLELAKYGNIVLVKGKNLDSLRKGEEEKLSSNGSGKSSIPEIIVYGLFGKTIKSPKKISHKDVLHNKTTKGLVIEIYWDNYKIERKRKPDSLKLWKSETGDFDHAEELTLGGMPATQKLIEDIIGLNYQTFINIFVFTDDNSTSFLECDASEKRSIVENLLSLEKYRGYLDAAKSLQKEHVTSIKNLQTEIIYVEKSHSDEEKNLQVYAEKKKIWKATKVQEVKNLAKEIEIAEKDLALLDKQEDVVAYEAAKKEIGVISEEIKKLEVNRDGWLNKTNELQSSLTNLLNDKNNQNELKQPYTLEKKECIANATKLKEVIVKIDKLEAGVVCSHCFGEVKPENYEKIKKEHEDEIASIKLKYAEADGKIKGIDAEIQSVEAKISQIQTDMQTNKISLQTAEKDLRVKKDKLANLQQIKLPDNSAKKGGLEEKIKITKGTVKKLLNEIDTVCPYDSLIGTSESKVVELKEKIRIKNEQLDNLVADTDYYSFWATAFGDNGIRKYIVDEIIPALNSNLNYWLQFLIDGKLEVNFDNELNETITKFPDKKPLGYPILSNGQRRRINLALSQAFAHVMTLNTGRAPSLVFLDEVSSNIDPVGVEGIYNMICELAREKQVFVTSHDSNLLELLNGCQDLNLVLKNGTSFLV